MPLPLRPVFLNASWQERAEMMVGMQALAACDASLRVPANAYPTQARAPFPSMIFGDLYNCNNHNKTSSFNLALPTNLGTVDLI